MIWIAATHQGIVVGFFISKAFYMGNEILILASMMTMFKESGLCSHVSSFMASVCGTILFPYCWLIGKYLDYTNNSLEGWSTLLYIHSAATVILILSFIPLKFNSITIKQTITCPS